MVKTITAVFILISFMAFTSGDHIWELRSNKNGIAVYTKTVEGYSVSSVKSVCTFNSTLSGMVALVLDIPAYKKWIFHCADAKILKWISPSKLIYYQEISVPWPADNRDFIARLKMSQDNKTGLITVIVENEPNYQPEKPGKVRLKKFSEIVIISPMGKNKSELSYEMLMDVGGNIPGWMVNMAITSGPYESLAEMRNLINTRAYSNARLGFIKEAY
jgi:hypothetical protein